MMLINKSKKEPLARDISVCKSFLSKIKGLMFAKPKAIILDFEEEKIIKLHMWFVFYPIDVLFLDKNKRVVEIKENFLPFTAYTSEKRAVFAVELPQGAISRSRTEVGDRIEW